MLELFFCLLVNLQLIDYKFFYSKAIYVELSS